VIAAVLKVVAHSFSSPWTSRSAARTAPAAGYCRSDVAAQLVVVADQIRAFAARMNPGAIGV
jgi:hypothetical protein